MNRKIKPQIPRGEKQKPGYRPRRPSHGGDLERAAHRRAKMLKLREEGWNFTKIAEKFGIHKSNVIRAVRQELDAISVVSATRAKHLRALELSRLDRILKGLWRGIEAGDPQSAAVALKIGERRARLLGLDLQPELPAGGPTLNLNFVTVNDPKMQVILQSADALELLHRITEGVNGNGHHLGNGSGGGNGLAAHPGDNGSEAEPGLPTVPPRQAP